MQENQKDSPTFQLPTATKEHNGGVLVTVLTIAAIIALILFSLFFFFIFLKLIKLYQEIGAQGQFKIFLSFFSSLLYPVALFMEIFYLRAKINKTRTISNKQEIIALILLIVGGFIFIYIGLLGAILPIYSLTTHF